MATNRILLIDDDQVTNFINTKLIKREFDLNVTAYTNAQEALNHLRGLTDSAPDDMPNVIFLDINMPIMDGWEFLELFQKFSESVLGNCKVIMLTSSIDLADIEKSKKYREVKDFVSKPLTREKIKSLIQHDI